MRETWSISLNILILLNCFFKNYNDPKFRKIGQDFKVCVSGLVA